MKKEELNVLKRWIDFSIAIKKMYLKIIELEQNGQQESEEYQNIMYLFPSAIQIENKILSSLSLTKDNYAEIKEIIDDNINQIHEEVVNEQSNLFDALRRSNRLDLLLLDHNNFFEMKKTHNIIEAVSMVNYQEELTSYKYANEFLKKLTTNHIAMIERMITKSKDKDAQNYLISLKYRMICITPPYEDNFVFFNCRILPTININQGVYQIDNMTTEEIKELNEFSLCDGFMGDILELLCLDNSIIDDPTNKKFLYRLLTLNEARLISLEDPTFIQDIQNKVIPMYPENENYSRIISLIEEMFEDAYNYLNEKQKKTNPSFNLK